MVRDSGALYLDTLSRVVFESLDFQNFNTLDVRGSSVFLGLPGYAVEWSWNDVGFKKEFNYPIANLSHIRGGDGFIAGVNREGEVVLFNKRDTIWTSPKQYDRVSWLKIRNKSEFWLGQRNEIHVFVKGEDNAIQEYIYNKEEGFMGGILLNEAIDFNHNKAFIGTIKGLVVAEFPLYRGTARDLTVSIEEILHNYQKVDWGRYSDSIQNNGLPFSFELPHTMNHLNFSFIAHHLKNPNEVAYNISLRGGDEVSFVTKKNTVEFVDLSPGDYELKITAKTQWSDWSSQPLIYRFTITPPFWRTIPFYVIAGVCAFGIVFAVFKYRTRKLEREKQKLAEEVRLRTIDLTKEKQKSEELLLNILPVEVANELKATGKSAAKKWASASVLFTDFKGFTSMSSEMNPELLVEKLDEIFMAFDEIVDQYDLEKIKTIGDAYMCVGGLPHENEKHAFNAVSAGLAMVEFMVSFNEKQRKLELPEWHIRVGIHTGELISGVVGRKKFAYDIWGDTVNIAARMESNSEPNKVNISKSTMLSVKEYFNIVPRGKITAKNRGDLEMFFVDKK